jgi:RimJ/RimL family protein N-acetyltransferase
MRLDCGPCDLVRLEAPVFEWDTPSMRVLEKCGFVPILYARVR